jgi:hypothetical protein
MRYRLPENVDRPTWEIALLHFAERQPSEAEFRRLLEQRMRRKHDQGGSLNSVDAGATVAAYLLHEWERYQVAARLPAGRQAKPTGGPAE